MAELSTKHFSMKQEKMVAEELSGCQVRGSGAAPCAPGDVRTYEWLAECKTHTKPGHMIVFKSEIWSKIQEEAFAIHRKPVLIVDDGSQKANKTWCLCKLSNVDTSRSLVHDIGTKPNTSSMSFDSGILSGIVSNLSSQAAQEHKDNVVICVERNCQKLAIVPLSTFKEIM